MGSISCRRHLQSGFTLLEILLVLVLIAVIAGLAMLSVGGGDHRRLHAEALRLKTVIVESADEALLQGSDLGLVFDETGYQVEYFDHKEGSWMPLTEKLFGHHEWPVGISVTMTLDGEDFDESALQQQAEDSDLDGPQLLFLSSGEASPFTIEFNSIDKEQRARLVSDGVSGVWLE